MSPVCMPWSFSRTNWRARGFRSVTSASVKRGRGFGRERLREPRLFARNPRLRDGPFFDRKKRTTRLAVQHKDVADFPGLRDRVDPAALVRDRHEIGRTGDVVVPDVVVHDLEMPDALASVRFQRQHAIGEKVLSSAVAAVMVVRSRTGAREHQAALNVERHPAPAIRAAGGFPGVGRPGLVAKFPRMRNRVKNPAALPGARVERADVAGRCW